MKYFLGYEIFFGVWIIFWGMEYFGGMNYFLEYGLFFGVWNILGYKIFFRV